ncbi:MAG TPA: two-component regulator propeller domain-containing protein [Saprospiraceae bacterium]|nr:two-component regulator propeller domain-containing protein [Saprospiraceae bacterium]
MMRLTFYQIILLALINAFFIQALHSQGSADDWTYYNASNSGLPGDRILGIEFDENGILWIGTYQKGLVRYDGESWTIFNTGRQFRYPK